jgi:tetratricopeptide (TPR) repeat protein
VQSIRSRILSLLILLLLCLPGFCREVVPFPRIAIHVAGHQGRWTTLVAWTILFALEDNNHFAVAAGRKALQVAEAEGIPDDPRVATSLKYLAVVYERDGKYAEAQSLLERALCIREKSLGAMDRAVGDELVHLARLNIAQKNFRQAENLYQRALQIRENSFPADERAPVADVLYELGLLYARELRYSEAQQLLQRARDIEENAPVGNESDVSDILNSQGALYVEQGQYPAAEQLHLRALQIQEAAFGQDDPAVLETLHALVALYERQGRNAEAAPLKKREFEIRRTALGSLRSEGQANARLRKKLAESVSSSIRLHNQAEHAKKVPLDEETIKFVQTYFSPEDWRVSAFLDVIAVQYRDGKAAYAKAEPLFRRAIRIQEKTLGTEDPSLAVTLTDYALLRVAQFKYPEAERSLLRAIHIQDKIMRLDQPEDPWMRNPRAALASLYRLNHSYPEAEALFQKVQSVQVSGSRYVKPQSYAEARRLVGLAKLRQEDGSYDEAAELIQKAVTLDSHAWGIGWGIYKNSTMAFDLAELAGVYIQQGKYREAELPYERALRFADRLGPEPAPGARIRWAMAQNYIRQGKYTQVQKLLRPALRREQQLGLQWHAQITAVFLALSYMDEGRYAEALPLLDQSLHVAETTMDRDSTDLANTLSMMAITWFGLGQPERGTPYLDRSVDILDRRLQLYFTYMSEAEQLRFLDTVWLRFPAYFSFVERFYDRDPRLPARMYDLILRQKGMVARSMESLRRRVAATGPQKASELLNELAAKRATISDLVNGPTGMSDPGQKTIAALERQADDVEHELLALSQPFAQQQELQSSTWQRVRDALPAANSDAAVEFVRYPFFDGERWTGTSHYAALVLKPDSQSPTFVPLGDASELEAEPVRDYLHMVLRPSNSAVGSSGAPLSETSSTFYKAFWEKVERALGPATRVYVAPDGILNEVSLDVVPLPGGRLLLDKYDLRVVNTTADLLREPVVLQGKSAILIGNPDFLLSGDDQKKALAEFGDLESHGEQTAEDARSSHDGAQDKLSSTELPHSGLDACVTAGSLRGLENTEQEVTEIFDVLRARDWDVDQPYTQKRALEEVVKKRVRHPRLLHIATHGFFCPERQIRKGNFKENSMAAENIMLNSGLLFAGAARAFQQASPVNGADDGVLTASEASLLDLEGTELVVLSACKSGVGESRAGEEVFGLRRALQEAGAATVLISMWWVPDDETRELMTLFYNNWLSDTQKMDKRQAFRKAQKDLRERVIERYRGDFPFYWGGFVLVGR